MGTFRARVDDSCRQEDLEVIRLLNRRPNDADRSSTAVDVVSGNVLGDHLWRTNGCRQCDALHFAGQIDDSLEAGHQLHAATILDDGMYFVDDRELNGGQCVTTSHGRQQQHQTLWGRNQNLRWTPQHPLTFGLWSISTPSRYMNVRKRLSRLVESFAKLG